MIIVLQKAGSDVNHTDKDGMTPLHHAAIHGNDVAASELLKCDNIRIEVCFSFFPYSLNFVQYVHEAQLRYLICRALASNPTPVHFPYNEFQCN